MASLGEWHAVDADDLNRGFWAGRQKQTKRLAERDRRIVQESSELVFGGFEADPAVPSSWPPAAGAQDARTGNQRRGQPDSTPASPPPRNQLFPRGCPLRCKDRARPP